MAYARLTYTTLTHVTSLTTDRDHLGDYQTKVRLGNLGLTGVAESLTNTLIALNKQGRFPCDRLIKTFPLDQVNEAQEASHSGGVIKPVLSDVIGEVSGKGVLRDIHRKYSPTAYEAMIMPILREIDRQKPVPPRGSAGARQDSGDSLTASNW